MAQGFTYEIRLRDLMSKGFQKVAQVSAKTYNSLLNNQQKFQASLKRIPASIAQLEGSLVSLQKKRDNAFTTRQIAHFNKQIRITQSRLEKLRNLPPLTLFERFKNLRRSMVGLLGLTSGLAIAMAGFSAVKGIVTLGAELQQTRISFQTMLQSAEKGNRLLEDINQLANATPFANRELQENAKMLLNFGIAGDKVIPTLKRLGDVSAGDKEKLKGLTLAFAQVSSAGKLQGQDLLQMINAGFNPLQEISRTTGESLGSLKDKMSKGAISAQMVEQAFVSVTSSGGMFHNMMLKQSETLNGKWSTFLGKFQDQLAKLGERLTPFLSIVVQYGIALVDVLPLIPAYFNDIAGSITSNLDVIIPLGIAVGALSAQMVFAKAAMLAMNIASRAQAIWTGILTAKQWLLNAAMSANPIGLVIALIAGLVAAVVLIKKRTEGWAQSFQAVGKIISTVAKMYWENIKFSFNMIWMGLQVLMLRFKQFAQWLKGLFMNVGKAIKLALEMDFSAAKKALSAPIKTSASSEIDRLNSKRLETAKQYGKTQVGYARDIVEASRKISIRLKPGRNNQNSHAADGFTGQTPGFEGSGAGSIGSGSAATANSIATSGKRQHILNVNIEKVVETINQHLDGDSSSAEEVVDTLLDELIRRLHGTFKALGS